MKVLKLESTNQTLFPNGSIVTLGNFDGLHKGHFALIEKVNSLKKELHLPSVLVTYYPNPAVVLGKNKELKNIYSETKKKEILSKTGIDFYLSIPFTYEFSQVHALDFIKFILVEKLKAKNIVLGYNHFFGKDKEGDFQYLARFSETYGYKVTKIEPVFVEGEKVASSLIRNLLQTGQIEKANQMLGRTFSILGLVVHGEGRGRKIQFPTANIQLEENMIFPGQGVYIGLTKFENLLFKAMINIGYKPTFAGKTLSIEAYLLEFEGDLYGKQVEVFFLKKIREEKKFENVNELIQQLNADKKFTIDFFENYPLQEEFVY